MQDVVKHNNSHKKKQHNGNYSIHYTMIAFIALIVFVVLSLTVLFNIETVIITGNSIYSAEEIVAASGLASGDNMIRKNMAKCEESITSQLIYIETATVKRSFPSSIKIIIKPCVETANFESEEGFFVISKGGKILRFTDEPDLKLLTFYGTHPKEEMAIGMQFESADNKKTENIFELIDKLNSSSMAGKVSSFDVTDRLNISCIYENRVTIEMGSVSELDYKFKAAENILTVKISPHTEGTMKIMSTGISFIDKDGLEINEQTYINNIHSQVADDVPEDTQNSTDASENTESTTSGLINFE